MSIQKKEIFTKEDIVFFVDNIMEFLEINENDINIDIRWDDKFLEKHFWINYSSDFYSLKRLPIAFIDIRNTRVGNCEINYNNHTDVMSLKFGIKVDNNKVFNSIVSRYSRIINLHNTDMEEKWEIIFPTSAKENRLIALEKLNKKIVRATSVMVELNHFHGYETSILDNNKCFKFDVNIDKEHLINKLKLTYYMEKNHTEFKEITGNTLIHNILNEPAAKIKKYVQILEMAHI